MLKFLHYIIRVVFEALVLGLALIFLAWYATEVLHLWG
ncbi:hypothetical protein LCGC14_3026410 [marine sediment metagenome]|uniref:Uncharacterized protein n=1 Tax=marine sediment metagenome TaxID=412755 RepID=A0A0F8WU17_9ZZZZ